ncbi:MAG: S41 family peptidase [Lachnospiraceae bacterium]|nr:S41 family peptidase [Lachnospiraceae bacterium]
MSEQDILENKEQSSEGEAALINEEKAAEAAAESIKESDAGSESRPAGPRRKKHLFVKGFAFGMAVMLFICAGVFLLLMLAKKVYLSGGGGIADSELIAKADSIAYYLNNYSLNGYDPDAVREGMLHGLMEGTGDKYAEYYTADELASLFDEYEGNFSGIGMIIRENLDGDVYISGLYENSPAQEAGFLEGDIIKAVDGESVEGLGRFEIAEIVRGEVGTPVSITIYRDSTGETLTITAVRQTLQKIEIEYYMVTDEIGYIWIQDFDEIAIDQFADALATLKGQGMQDMIIDLRSNTGGLLRAALNITRQIMCKGTIVSTRNAQGETEVYTCDGNREFQGRIVILTDGYTASASEIMTGALRDNGMAITLGTNTFGKGVVQDFFYLSDASGIKFTTEEYLTPNGTAINGVGIAPDIELDFDIDRYMEEGIDNQIEAAVQYLENN